MGEATALVVGEGKLRKGTRRLSIALAALAVLALAWMAPPESQVAGALAPEASRTDPSAAAARARLAKLPERPGIGEPRGDPFATPAPAAPPAKPAPAAAAPPAAPNPYRVAGVVRQDGVQRVFLAARERAYEVKKGDELDGGYRVEEIASGHVLLVNVSLGTKEQLPIPASLVSEPLQTASPAAPAVPGSAPVADAKPAAPPAGADRPAQLRWEGPERVRAGASFSVALRVSSDQPLRCPVRMTGERFSPERDLFFR